MALDCRESWEALILADPGPTVPQRSDPRSLKYIIVIEL